MLDIDWRPDKDGDRPIHKQIAEFIKKKIAAGEWPVGSVLPPQRQLALQMGVNRSTIVSAIEELIAEGLLEGNRRAGTRVINNTWSLLNALPPPDWSDYIRSGTYNPNQDAVQKVNKYEYVPDIIRLGTGELAPGLVSSDGMQQVLGRLAGKRNAMGYVEGKGLPELREEISKHLRGMGIEASPASILVVSGALQAFQLISVGLLHRGATVFVEKPSYLYSMRVFQSAGMQLYGLPMDEGGIQIKSLLRQRKQHNGSILCTIPSFHNPTGILMTEERRKELVAVCEKEQLPIIEDDIYGELWLDSPPPKPLKSIDKNGLVLYIGGLSKALCPGLRIGWVVAPEPVIDRLADIKMQTDYGSSSLSQWAAVEWLSGGLYMENLNHVRGQLRERRRFMLELLDGYFKDIAEWSTPAGSFYVWTRIKADIPMQKLFDKALSTGILLNPGYIYDNSMNSYLRLSYAYASPEEMERGMCRLAQLIKEI